MPEPRTSHRRWNVILSGLLIGALAIIVIFTSRAAFVSAPTILVVAAIGLVALLLQLRFRYQDLARTVQVPLWLNLAGIAFALVALFPDVLHLRRRISELFALFAIGCFAVSGGFVLHRLRERRDSNNPLSAKPPAP